ncbi:hypothetical protein EXIGLDRAFT_489656 [Exidia glandulosa HHB12029]|uniref:Uncharacterized protein n=1 Tax=Exidia glandulosa HHB12029 TaxID=1314781 RepID=A0A166NCU0_EXIGL|nr:hypothetical protein EXIGLDRAFT_489656 [Exidia glandulosa HHB12029]
MHGTASGRGRWRDLESVAVFGQEWTGVIRLACAATERAVFRFRLPPFFSSLTSILSTTLPVTGTPTYTRSYFPLGAQGRMQSLTPCTRTRLALVYDMFHIHHPQQQPPQQPRRRARPRRPAQPPQQAPSSSSSAKQQLNDKAQQPTGNGSNNKRRRHNASRQRRPDSRVVDETQTRRPPRRRDGKTKREPLTRPVLRAEREWSAQDVPPGLGAFVSLKRQRLDPQPLAPPIQLELAPPPTPCALPPPPSPPPKGRPRSNSFYLPNYRHVPGTPPPPRSPPRSPTRSQTLMSTDKDDRARLVAALMLNRSCRAKPLCAARRLLCFRKETSVGRSGLSVELELDSA